MNRLLSLLLVLSIALLAACGTTDSFGDFDTPELDLQTAPHIKLMDAPAKLDYDEATNAYYLTILNWSTLDLGCVRPMKVDKPGSSLDLFTGIPILVDVRAKVQIVASEDDFTFTGQGTAILKTEGMKQDVEIIVSSIFPCLDEPAGYSQTESQL